MSIEKGIVYRLMLSILIMIFSIGFLVGCNDNNNTVQTCVISNQAYETKEDIEATSSEDSFSEDDDIFVSIHFIESPKGMKYGVKWFLDNKEIKYEVKETQNDMQDILVYELESDKVVKGQLKFEILYNDTILLTQEATIQ